MFPLRGVNVVLAYGIKASKIARAKIGFCVAVEANLDGSLGIPKIIFRFSEKFVSQYSHHASIRRAFSQSPRMRETVQARFCRHAHQVIVGRFREAVQRVWRGA